MFLNVDFWKRVKTSIALNVFFSLACLLSSFFSLFVCLFFGVVLFFWLLGGQLMTGFLCVAFVVLELAL